MRLRVPVVVSAAAASLLAAPLGLAGTPDEVVIRGVAVCLDSVGAVSAEGQECGDHPLGGWALRDARGALHGLSPDDERVAMLSDGRVRSRELEVTAWRDEDGRLAIVHLYTLIDGQRRNPHYYCPTCTIRTTTPGLCWCCGAPLELREPPVEEEPEAAHD